MLQMKRPTDSQSPVSTGTAISLGNSADESLYRRTSTANKGEPMGECGRVGGAA